MTKFYFDTSILIPVLIEEHENHEQCKEIFAAALREGTVLSSATHTYAELYRTLTRGIPPYKVTPELAEVAITKNIAALITMVELTQQDYELAIRRCVKLGLTSSIIYDALHIQAAIKAEANILYTDNLRDFTRLVTDDLTLEVRGVR